MGTNLLKDKQRIKGTEMFKTLEKESLNEKM